MGKSKLVGCTSLSILNGYKYKALSSISKIKPGMFCTYLKRNMEMQQLPSPEVLSVQSACSWVEMLSDNRLCIADYRGISYGDESYACIRILQLNEGLTKVIDSSVFLIKTPYYYSQNFAPKTISASWYKDRLVVTFSGEYNSYTDVIYTTLLKVEGVKITKLDQKASEPYERAGDNLQHFRISDKLYQFVNRSQIQSIDIKNDKLILGSLKPFGITLATPGIYASTCMIRSISNNRILFYGGELNAYIRCGKVNIDGTITWGNKYTLNQGSGYVWGEPFENDTKVLVQYAVTNQYTSTKALVLSLTDITLVEESGTITTFNDRGKHQWATSVSEGFIFVVEGKVGMLTYEKHTHTLKYVPITPAIYNFNFICTVQQVLKIPQTNIVISTKDGSGKIWEGIAEDCLIVGGDTVNALTVTQCSYNKKGNFMSYAPIADISTYGILGTAVDRFKDISIEEVKKEVQNG